MLLRHTTDDVADRQALTVNPAKTCQPIGAMYAALGIHRCLPHSHGSQGCCSYHRSTLTRHYKEPVMAATQLVHRRLLGVRRPGQPAAGDLQHLLPSTIPTSSPSTRPASRRPSATTSRRSSSKARDEGKDSRRASDVIHANTPSYVGSHVTGFANMVKGMVHYLSAQGPTKNKTLNVIPGWVEPADMREISRMTDLMGVETILFPDTSDVLDAPQTGKHVFYPKGGVTIGQLQATGASRATLALGPTASEPAARELDAKCRVPYHTLEIPIGLKATDRFVHALRKLTHQPVPERLLDERGRLMDVITDMHQYFYGKRVALWGDPDQLVPLAEFLADIDMRPVYIVTGTPGKQFERRIEAALAGRVHEAKVRQGAVADMFLMHQWIKEERVDLLIGNTYGKYIARDDDIPLVRHGFPILDRIGHSYFPTVGYFGGIRLLEKILAAFLDRQDRDAAEERFELVM